MVFFLYNKVLLRFIVALCGIGVGLTAWQYLALSQAKLGRQGLIDAFAIICFPIAAWLIMLTAEVVDNHYVRAFSCLCMLLGGFVSYGWIFRQDGPILRALPGGPAGMQIITLGFWLAMLLSLAMLTLLVIRLIRDKQNLGRIPGAQAQLDQILATAPASPAGPRTPEKLEPIPIDTTPIGSAGSTQPAAAAEPVQPQRSPAPVSKLVAIGGLYLGTEYPLGSGEHGIGRADAEILLDRDNQVSRNHAGISVDEQGMATLSDRGSTNGTFLNNAKIDSAALAPGDVIRIGTTQFRVEGSS
ncbi:MAG: FHA domain-containing protein [bacterium]